MKNRLPPFTHGLAALAICLALALDCAAARDLAVEESELIPVELASVGIVPMTGAPVVLLREPESGRIVPIFIGPNEARAIIMAQREMRSERPMTHDLANELINALGGRLSRLIVDELRDGTYLGVLELEGADDDRVIRVDTRPSDGLALAVRAGAAILVAPDILAAGEDIPFEGMGEDGVVTALGITVMAVSDELRQALQLPDEPGVLVNAVRGMAELAGMRPGALILSVNDQSVDSPMDFLDLVNATPTDEDASLRYWHDGEQHDLDLSTDVPDRAQQGERRDRL